MTEKIIDIISKAQGIPKEKITPESHLIQDLGLTSYDVVSLTGRFEDEFDIEIPDRMIRSLKTVGDVEKLVGKLAE